MNNRPVQQGCHRHRGGIASGHLLRYGRALGRTLVEGAVLRSNEVCLEELSHVEFVLEFMVLCRFAFETLGARHAGAIWERKAAARLYRTRKSGSLDQTGLCQTITIPLKFCADNEETRIKKK